MTVVRSPYDLAPEDLSTLASGAGEPPYRARQLARWLDVRKVADPAVMTDLPEPFRAWLTERWASSGLRLRTRQAGDGGWTHKFLFALRGSDAVETVLMLYPPQGQAPQGTGPAGVAPVAGGAPLEADDWEGSREAPSLGSPVSDPPTGRATVCVSTQAGCAQGCPFCATGQFGFTRQLSAGEIVEQVAVVWAALPGLRPHPGAPDHVTNVVFMGMGEPFANPSATFAALLRLRDGFGLSARALTVSTIGLVPQIRRLTRELPSVNLAVSLHAPDDELRDRLVPVNRTWPIRKLLDAVEAHIAATRRRVSFEYALMAGVNDAPAQADALGRLLAPLRLPGGGYGAHVNAIPLNPTPGSPLQAPSSAAVRRFRDGIAAHGVPVSIRANRGVGIAAACGQLRTAAGRPGRQPLAYGGDAGSPPPSRDATAGAGPTAGVAGATP